MSNPISSPASAQAPLTLHDVPHRERLSRLMPCGTLNRKQKGTSCKVFLKRTRAGDKILLQTLKTPLKTQGHQESATSRLRSRRGSFLRLASRPKQLVERASA